MIPAQEALARLREGSRLFVANGVGPPNLSDGTVAERTNAPALKADVGRLTEGSNPSRSAFGSGVIRRSA